MLQKAKVLTNIFPKQKHDFSGVGHDLVKVDEAVLKTIIIYVQ